MNRQEKLGFRMLAEEVSISNDTRVTGLNNNDLIIGGTGSGKTGGYLFQLLLNPYGSMIISDTKGQLCKKFKRYLQSKGYVVKVLDLVRPQKSVAYNPLEYIGRDKAGNYYENDIKKLAKLLVPVLDSKEPFWEKSAVRYITVLIAYILEALPEKDHNLATVVRLHQEFRSGEGRDMIEEWKDKHPDSFCSKKYKEICDAKDAEKMWLSILEFANEALDPFSYKEYNRIFKRADELDLARIGKEKTVLFINNTDNDSTFDMFSNILYVQTMQVLMAVADANKDGELKVPVRLVFDDFPASPTIDDFDKYISVIRSRNISVSVIIQSISQLWTKYSEAVADTIINNCDHTIYLSGHDQKTAEFLAQHVDNTSTSILLKKRGDAILLTDGEKAKTVKKLTPYPVDPDKLVATNYKAPKAIASKRTSKTKDDRMSLDEKLELLKEIEESREYIWVDTRTDEERWLDDQATLEAKEWLDNEYDVEPDPYDEYEEDEIEGSDPSKPVDEQ